MLYCPCCAERLDEEGTDGSGRVVWWKCKVCVESYYVDRLKAMILTR